MSWAQATGACLTIGRDEDPDSHTSAVEAQLQEMKSILRMNFEQVQEHNAATARQLQEQQAEMTEQQQQQQQQQRRVPAPLPAAARLPPRPPAHFLVLRHLGRPRGGSAAARQKNNTDVKHGYGGSGGRKKPAPLRARLLLLVRVHQKHQSRFQEERKKESNRNEEF